MCPDVFSVLSSKLTATQLGLIQIKNSLADTSQIKLHTYNIKMSVLVCKYPLIQANQHKSTEHSRTQTNWTAVFLKHSVSLLTEHHTYTHYLEMQR